MVAVRREQAGHWATQSSGHQQVEATPVEEGQISERLVTLSEVETLENPSPDRLIRECVPMDLRVGFDGEPIADLF